MAYDMMDKVETGYKAQLLLNEYIDDNDIKVSKFRQNNSDAEHNSITVFAKMPRTELDRDQDTWDIPTQIICYTHSADDQQLILMRKLIDAVFEVVIETAYSVFSTSGNIGFLGISFDGDSDEEYEGKVQTVTFNILTKVADVNQ